MIIIAYTKIELINFNMQLWSVLSSLENSVNSVSVIRSKLNRL